MQVCKITRSSLSSAVKTHKRAPLVLVFCILVRRASFKPSVRAHRGASRQWCVVGKGYRYRKNERRAERGGSGAYRRSAAPKRFLHAKTSLSFFSSHLPQALNLFFLYFSKKVPLWYDVYGKILFSLCRAAQAKRALFVGMHKRLDFPESTCKSRGIGV